MNDSQSNSSRITATLFTDPSCPWAYSVNPAFRSIEWRYRDQIDWKLTMIGLSDADNPRDYRPWSDRVEFLTRQRDRYGMPFVIEPKVRPFSSARACQAVVAARLVRPGTEWRVYRAIQLLHFNTPILIDDDDHLIAAIESVPGVDALRTVLAIDTPEVHLAYREEREKARTATGGPAALQERTAVTPEGDIRFTAPSVVFNRNGSSLEVGGFQPLEAYDLAIANLGPGLRRVGPSADPLEVLRLYPGGLTTQEIAAVMTPHLEPVDREGTANSLRNLLGQGSVKRVPLGDDAIWLV